MGSGFSKAKKQARNLEDQMKKIELEQSKLLVTGSAGNNLVKVTLNGKKELQNIIIHPDCVVPNDVDGLQDLIVAAFQDALRQIDEKNLDSPIGGLSFFNSL
ncbi:MAG: YbaB/EbfC family nucleoid-associated protein [Chlamydiales bacterium]